MGEPKDEPMDTPLARKLSRTWPRWRSPVRARAGKRPRKDRAPLAPIGDA